ncbi:response regulator transcription factor, partial [Escherichia coli]|nr:response regulator transcription factor [Escherichia coli]
MTYDLITTCLQCELPTRYLTLHHLPDLNTLLSAVENNKIDVLMINSSCLFDGFFHETEIRKMLSVICPHQQMVTVLFAQNMKPMLLRKMVHSGMNILISPHDTPHELLKALMSAIASPHAEPYVSQTIRELLQHPSDELTTKEWEVLNLINQGYSLSQIASKKCRAMSTVSTQKRKAMDKL